MTIKNIGSGNINSLTIMKFTGIFLPVCFLLVAASCDKFSDDNPSRGDVSSTFYASFADTKSVACDGAQSFEDGEVIDLWDIDSHELIQVSLESANISPDGKSVTFTAAVDPSASILAIYPGGYSSDYWETGASAPTFDLASISYDGIASAVCPSGNEHVFTFSNLLSCISFSSSKSVSAVNCNAYLFGNDEEVFPSSISINPIDGKVSASTENTLPYYYTTSAYSHSDDIRLWVVPGLSFSNGFTLKVGSAPDQIVFERKVKSSFSVGENAFIELGDIDEATMTFQLEVDSVTSINGSISFTPSDNGFYYIPFCEKSEAVAKYTDDATLSAAVLNYFEEKYGDDYDEYGDKSYVEFMLNRICRKGSDSIVMSGLQADTDYTAIAFAVDEDLNVLSHVAKVAFHTDAASTSMTYDDFLGNWKVSGTTPSGSFDDCVWKFEVKEKDKSYTVSGLLSKEYVYDSYTAEYDATTQSVKFAVGADNQGTRVYDLDFFNAVVFLIGVTPDKKFAVPFSLVAKSRDELELTGAAYIAGEYHEIASSGNPILDSSWGTTPEIAITSIIRATE